MKRSRSSAAAESHLNDGADAGRMRRGGSSRVDDLRKNALLITGLAQRLHQDVGIARRARGRRIRCVREEDRPLDRAGLGDRALDRDELALHAEALRPEFLCEAHGFPRGQFAIAVGHDEDLAAQFGDVGEGVSDHDAGRERPAVTLEALAFADQVAVAPRLGDEFVAADQGRHRDPGDDGPGPRPREA